MKPSVALAEHRDAVRCLITAHGAANPRIFGSVLHGDDQDGSDLDILLEPIPGRLTLLGLARMKQELEDLLGVPVDLATPNALRDSMRRAILDEAILL